MGQRPVLHQTLIKLAGPEPEDALKVYFQAPTEDLMVYPCIEYNLDDEYVIFADNNPYSRELGYQITVIDRNPDSLIPGLVAMLPKCSFQRRFVVDGLYHTVYKLFF